MTNPTKQIIFLHHHPPPRGARLPSAVNIWERLLPVEVSLPLSAATHLHHDPRNLQHCHCHHHQEIQDTEIKMDQPLPPSF